ncbi:hypothetical protein LP420_03220 [Massilia sp. B-10]|nr:hypothetical protein LP420_03220 [Massilia sp. B-10]
MTVRVLPGTYSGGFQTIASGTADARIRYVSEVKRGAKIVPASQLDDDQRLGQPRQLRRHRWL